MTYVTNATSSVSALAEVESRSTKQIDIILHGDSQPCPTTAHKPACSEIALTLFTNDGQRALTKRIWREAGILKKEAAAQMSGGRYQRITVAGIEGFAAFLTDNRRRHDRAVCFGVPRERERGTVASETAIRAGKAPAGAVARTLEHWTWAEGQPGVFFGDIDPGAAMAGWGPAEFDAAICAAAPWIAPVRRFYVPSASSEIYDSTTGELVSPKSGLHLYFALDDAARTKNIGEALFVALFDAGHGWIALSKSGALLRRTIIDSAVWQEQRLDFFADPVLGAGLEKRHSIAWFGEDPLLRTAAVPRVDMDGWREFSATLKQLEAEARPEAAATRGEWVGEQVAKAVKRGMPKGRAKAIYTAAVDGGKLYAGFQLHTPNGRTVTAGEMLRDLRTWDRAVLCDPLEPDYGSRDCAKAYLLNQKDGPVIHSLAHGGAWYRLSSDLGPQEYERDEPPFEELAKDLRGDREPDYGLAGHGADTAQKAEREAFEPPVTFSARELRQTKAPPRAWLLDQIIPADDVTLLGGDGASGKTTLGFQLGTAMENGLLFLSKPVKAGPTLYMTAEESANEVAIRAEMAASNTGSLASLHEFQIASFADREEPAMIVVDGRGKARTTIAFDWMRAEAVRMKAKLIIIDAVADFIAVQEMDRQQVRAAVAKLRKLCIELELAIILVAHPSVDGMKTGRGYSGSTHWNNAVRSRLYLTQPDPDDNEGRLLEHMKTNRGAKHKPIPLRFVNGRYEVDNSASRQIISGDAAIRDRFLDLLRLHNRQGIAVSANPGKNYAPAKFAEHVDGGKIGRKLYERAMQQLLIDQRIRNDEKGPPSKRREFLVVVEG